MATTTDPPWAMTGGNGPSRPDLNRHPSSTPQTGIESPSPIAIVTATTHNNTFLSLPSEIRHQVYKQCNQTSMSLMYTPPEWKSTNHLTFKHTVQSTLYALSRTCRLLHADLLDTEIFPNIHLEIGIDKHMNTDTFLPEPRSGYRATYSEVLRYLSGGNKVQTISNKNMQSNSGIPSHIVQKIVRITTFESFAADVPISSFRPTLPNLEGVTMIMPRLYTRELQSLVSKGRPERWVDKLVNKGYRWMLPECPGTIDRMIFQTVKNFDCLTCLGEITKLHAVGISVTVSTSSWTVIQTTTKKGTFKDRDRESRQTSRKKHEKRPESWEGYECLCDFDGMVAWWLGLDVDVERRGHGENDGDESGSGSGSEGRLGLAEFGREYLE